MIEIVSSIHRQWTLTLSTRDGQNLCMIKAKTSRLMMCSAVLNPTERPTWLVIERSEE